MSTTFENAFADLKSMGDRVPGAKRTYELLQHLDFDTPDDEADLLLEEFRNIRYASNTNSFFHFYFPIVTHILYYKPTFEKEILSYLIGPNFANGTMETKTLIPLIQRAMAHKLSIDKYYLTQQSQDWITNELPKMGAAVEREVQICLKELDE